MFGMSPEAKATRELRRLVMGLGMHAGITVNRTHLKCVGQPRVPIAGAVVTVDKGEAATRITASRVLLTGPFALLLKKDATKLFITIEGTDGSVMLLDIPASNEAGARRFALQINSRR